jgi:pyruvate/2-oxoglutarate/acetoin dehydrogenase E1 component
MSSQAREQRENEREISYVRAIYEALQAEMGRDERVFLMGEDVRLSVYGTTKGLYDEFGPMRVRNTPITEEAVVGAALGASLMGLRPVVDLMQGNFMYVAWEQFADQAAKARYMFGGQISFPTVFMAAVGAFDSAAAQHSDSPHPLFMNLAGLKVVLPSSPRDAKGLLISAIRDPDPVIYLTPMSLMAGEKGPVPQAAFTIPIGEAEVKRPGEDVTIVAIGGMVRQALSAAEMLRQEGVEAEVIDPRSLRPMDWEAIIRSARKTGRLVVVDEARRTCSAASEIAATAYERCFEDLKAPARIVASPDVPIPFSPPLEAAVIPNAEKIVAAVHSLELGSRT